MTQVEVTVRSGLEAPQALRARGHWRAILYHRGAGSHRRGVHGRGQSTTAVETPTHDSDRAPVAANGSVAFSSPSLGDLVRARGHELGLSSGSRRRCRRGACGPPADPNDAIQTGTRDRRQVATSNPVESAIATLTWRPASSRTKSRCVLRAAGFLARRARARRHRPRPPKKRGAPAWCDHNQLAGSHRITDLREDSCAVQHVDAAAVRPDDQVALAWMRTMSSTGAGGKDLPFQAQPVQAPIDGHVTSERGAQ